MCAAYDTRCLGALQELVIASVPEFPQVRRRGSDSVMELGAVGADSGAWYRASAQCVLVVS